MAKGLTTKQLEAIQWIAQIDMGGMTYTEIAAELGVTDRTLRNWRNEPLFEAELSKQQRRIVGDKMAKVHALAVGAFEADPSNAALYRELRKAAGETDKVEVDARVTGDVVDTSTLAERLAAAKAGIGGSAA
jgi:predicted transcriptional regulator